jgi:hypothetical protein
MTTKEYQNEIFNSLIEILGEASVKKEWDSVKYDSHLSNHKQVYAPRLDIAVGPFNSDNDLDLGWDHTDVMKKHPLTKRLVNEINWNKEDFKKCWNNFSRCYLAIEIELGRNRTICNSSKHILGSIINASVTGSIGVVITDQNTFDKVYRLYSYLQRLRDLDRLFIKTFDNLIIIDKEEFIPILLETKEKLKITGQTTK